MGCGLQLAVSLPGENSLPCEATPVAGVARPPPCVSESCGLKTLTNKGARGRVEKSAA